MASHQQWAAAAAVCVLMLAVGATATAAAAPRASNSTNNNRVAPPAWLAPSSSSNSKPYILLDSSKAPSITLRVNTGRAETVRIAARNLRGAAIHKAALRSTGAQASIEIKVPPGNEYLAVAVFAKDLEPGANVDIALQYKNEVITESTNPPGTDDILEAQEGLMPGNYVVTVKGSQLPNVTKALTASVYIWMLNEKKKAAGRAAPPPPAGAPPPPPPPELGMQIRPNPVQLTADPNCCAVELAVTGISSSQQPQNQRYIGMLQWTREDGTPLEPGAGTPTMVYLF